MKKLIIFLFVASVFFYTSWRIFNFNVVPYKKISKLAPTKFYAIATAPLNLKAAIVPANVTMNNKISFTKSSIPMECQDQWDRLISIGPTAFRDELKISEYKKLDSCFKFIQHSEEVRQLVKGTCDNEAGIIKNEGLCLSSVVMYRALLIDLSTKDDKSYSSMTMQMLLNKIMGKIIQGEDIYKASANDLRSMALAVKEQEPNNPSSYRVLGAVEMVLNNLKNAEYYTRQGLNIDPTDSALRDIWFFTQLSNRNFNFGSYVESNPNDDIAAYYFAAQLWRDSKIIESRNVMKRLVQVYPDSSRYKIALEKITKSNDPNEHAFQIDVPVLQDGW